MEAPAVASAVSAFLVDPAITSLQLPHMTSNQRKSLKKHIQQHPEIRCESYGFGEDRQLYLFKTCADQGCLAGTALAEMLGRSSSPEGSTATPSDASSDHSSELPSTAAMQVRNTFIHFEDNEYVDNRAVQSMPRNMFRHCVEVEAEQQENVMRATQAKPGKSAHPVESADAQDLTSGALVIVDGLVKLPAFNGNSAIVQGWDAAAGRYDILIANPSAAGGFQQAKIKRENLRLVLSNAVAELAATQALTPQHQ
jgi:hypothetical protein